MDYSFEGILIMVIVPRLFYSTRGEMRRSIAGIGIAKRLIRRRERYKLSPECEGDRRFDSR